MSDDAQILAARRVGIDKVEWSVRVTAILMHHKVRNLGQIADHSEEEVNGWINMGPLALREIKETLAEYGLSLREGPADAGGQSKWQKQRERWLEMKGAWERVPEAERLDPACVEFRAENTHFVALMEMAATTLPEIAEKIELATTRDGGWEPTVKWWGEVVEDIMDFQRRLTGTPLELDTLSAPPNAAVYRERVTTAVLDGIITASQVADGATGRKVANIDGGAVIEVLVRVMALMFCQSEECSTPQRARIASEKIAKRLRMAALDARERGLSIELHQLPQDVQA